MPKSGELGGVEQKLKNFKFAHGAKRPVWRMTDPGRKRHFDTKGPGRAKYWSFDLGPRGKRGRAAATCAELSTMMVKTRIDLSGLR